MCAIDVVEEEEDELVGRAPPWLELLEQLLESEQSRANCKLKRCMTASAFRERSLGKLELVLNWMADSFISASSFVPLIVNQKAIIIK